MKKQLIILTSSFILVFLSCKKENTSDSSLQNPEPEVTTTSLTGFGDRGGKLSGKLFYLPKNVKVTAPMIAWDSTYLSYEFYGIGYFRAYLTLTNFNNFSIAVTLPAGLIYLPDNETTSQSGLNIYPITFTLPSNAGKKVCLSFFCINVSKGSHSQTTYTTDVVSNNDQVVKLINSLKVKSDSTLIKHAWDLQYIVWNISDSTGLTQANLDSVASW